MLVEQDHKKLKALVAERDRLREALEHIQDLNPEAEEVRESPSLAAYALNPIAD